MQCLWIQLDLLHFFLLLRDVAYIDNRLSWAHFITLNRVVDEDDVVSAALDAQLLLEAVDDGEDDNYNNQEHASEHYDVLVILKLQVSFLDYWGDFLFWRLFPDGDFIDEDLLRLFFIILLLSFLDNLLQRLYLLIRCFMGLAKVPSLLVLSRELVAADALRLLKEH